MTYARMTVSEADKTVGIVEDTAALGTFLQPECSAAVWGRQTPPHVQDWLDALDPESLPRGRVVLQTGEVAEAVAHMCAQSDLPAGPERTWLQNDIVTLANTFADLMSARHLRLRLDVVNTNACRKFHIDAIRARLVCTYRGTGTQYGISTNGDDPIRIVTVQTGAPILLRGTLWPAKPPLGLLHRSPPIEGSGETRLVLVLDPIFDPDDAY